MADEVIPEFDSNRLADIFESSYGATRWSNLPEEDRARDFVSTNINAGRNYDEANQRYREIFGRNHDLGAHEAGYRQVDRRRLQEADLAQQRERVAGRQESNLSYAINQIPFGSEIAAAGQGIRYTNALQRHRSGQSTPDDRELIATYEQLHNRARAPQSAANPEGRTQAQQVQDSLLGVGRMVGEAYLGGQVIGQAGSWAGAGANTGIRRAGAFALSTAATPALYVHDIIDRNIEQGRSAYDIRGVPAAATMALLQNAAFGLMKPVSQGIAGAGLRATATRMVAGIAQGMGLQHFGIEPLAELISTQLPQAYRLNTGNGLLSNAFQGKWGEAWQQFGMSLVTFAAFAGLHEIQGRGSQGVLAEAQKSMEAMAKDGVSRPEVLQTMQEALSEAQKAVMQPKTPQEATQGTPQQASPPEGPPPVPPGPTPLAPPSPLSPPRPGVPPGGPGQPATVPPRAANAAGKTVDLSGMGGSITENMYKSLWGQVQKGSINEAGQPSAVLQAAKMIRDRGGMKTVEDLKILGQEMGKIDNLKSTPQWQTAMHEIVDRMSQTPTEPVTPPRAANAVHEPVALVERPGRAVTTNTAAHDKAELQASYEKSRQLFASRGEHNVETEIHIGSTADYYAELHPDDRVIYPLPEGGWSTVGGRQFSSLEEVVALVRKAQSAPDSSPGEKIRIIHQDGSIEVLPELQRTAEQRRYDAETPRWVERERLNLSEAAARERDKIHSSIAFDGVPQLNDAIKTAERKGMNPVRALAEGAPDVPKEHLKEVVEAAKDRQKEIDDVRRDIRNEPASVRREVEQRLQETLEAAEAAHENERSRGPEAAGEEGPRPGEAADTGPAAAPGSENTPGGGSPAAGHELTSRFAEALKGIDAGTVNESNLKETAVGLVAGLKKAELKDALESIGIHTTPKSKADAAKMVEQVLAHNLEAKTKAESVKGSVEGNELSFGQRSPESALPGGGQENAQAGGRPVPETALANKKIAEERAQSRIPQIESQARQANSEIWDAAMKVPQGDIDRLMTELETKARPTSTAESALVLRQRIALRNEFEKKVSDAVNTKLSKATRDKAFDEALKLEQQIDVADKIARDTGSEAGRAFQFRRQLADYDYSLGKMLLSATAARGKSLSPEEMAHVADLQKQITELQAKLDAADAALNHAGGGINSPAYPGWKQADISAKDGQQSFKRQLVAWKWENMSWQEKALDWWRRVRIAEVVSSPITALKVGSSSVLQTVAPPIREMVGSVLKTLPGIRWVAKKAPIEGRGFNAATEGAAMKQAWTEGLKDAKDIMKTGRSSLDIQYGGTENERPRSWIDLIGQSHAALKAPAVRGAWERAYRHIEASEKAAGRDVSSADAVRNIGQQAYEQSRAAKFQQDNAVVTAVDRVINNLKQPDKSLGAKIIGHAADTLLPIRRTPTNIVADALEHVFGLPVGGARVLKAKLNEGALTTPQAESIMRQLKKGTLGIATLALGYYLGDKVSGGFYSGKRREDDLKPGEISTPMGVMPAWLTAHHPAMMMMHLGAAIRRDENKARSEPSTLASAVRGLGALIEEVPFVREPREVAQLLAFNEHAVGNLAKSLAIPAFLEWIAKQGDTAPSGNPVHRYPHSVGQHIKMGIPGLRQTVPTVPRGQ